jgi:transcriptional regulator with XRE-family HTH domain
MSKETHKPENVEWVSQLAAVCKRSTIARVAARLGASEAAVRSWLKGDRSPSGTARGRLRELYGIAWARPSTARSRRPAPTLAPAARKGAAQGLAQATGAESLARIVEQLEAEIANCGSDVPRNHVAALYGQLTATIARKAKIDGEGEITVGAILRSRAWGQIEGVLVQVLRTHSSAAEELAEALDGLKGQPR